MTNRLTRNPSLLKGLAALLALGACSLWLLPGRAQTPQPPPPPPPQPEAKVPLNVIVVGFDTTRADHLGAYGYQRDTSPNVDRFASQGVLFERCYSQSNETLAAFASLLTSRLPSEIAPLTYEDFYITSHIDTLQSVLGIYGYETAAFVAGGNLHRNFGFDHAFDVYEDQWNFGSFFHTLPPALEWLDARQSEAPFFLFVQGYDAHATYVKPLYFENLFDPGYSGIADEIAYLPLAAENVWNGRYYQDVAPPSIWKTNSRDVHLLGIEIFSLLALQDERMGQPLSQQDLDHITAHYDGCIAHADLHFGLFMDGLRQRGLLDDSLIIVLGDHGEDLMEHGHYNHRISLHDASTHVPLILRFPDLQGHGQRVDATVQLLDVMPTVLDYLDLPAPAYARGRSLLPLLEGAEPQPPWNPVAFSEGILPMASVRSREHRLVIEGYLAGGEEFQQLLTTVTPAEESLALFRIDAQGEHRAQLEPGGADWDRAQSLLNELRRAYAEGHAEPLRRKPYIDPELRRIMVEKGYW